ncbi:MAG: hypothetical protein AABY79_08745 [Nitrospirota bacterium]
MGVYEEVKQALQDIVAPELRALQVEIKRLDEKIDSLRNEVTTEIKRLDEKIDIAIQIRERLASLEAKVSAMGRYKDSRNKNTKDENSFSQSGRKVHTLPESTNKATEEEPLVIPSVIKTIYLLFNLAQELLTILQR